MVTPREREQMGPALAALREARSVVLACHINPDGDTLGSMIALALGLEHLGKTCTLLSSDGVPAIYTFLPETERIVRRAEEGAATPPAWDLAIVLDAGDITRVGAAVAETVLSAAPRLMDIDHHVTAGQFGDIRLLDAEAAATGEIIYDLLIALGVPITLPIAECLLCALLTDTGSFRFPNVTPRTLEIAAELVRIGASPNRVAEQVFENKPFATQKLLGRALDALQRTPDGRVVWAHVTQADFLEFGAGDEETEGIVNAIRSGQGAEVALFLREMATGKLRVSLRSRDPVDVSLVAKTFGGGGHRLAAGGTLDGPLAEAEARLVAEVQKCLTAS